MFESMAEPPKVVVIAGPNGAGKSTAASRILQEAFAVQEFVNADVIARGLSAFKPESVALMLAGLGIGGLVSRRRVGQFAVEIWRYCLA